MDKLNQVFTFDKDGNIGFFDTPINLVEILGNGEKRTITVDPHELDGNPEKYSNTKKYLPINQNSFIHFVDYLAYLSSDTEHRGPDGLLQDIVKFLGESKFGPSFESFIRAIKSGSLIAILTARGHGEDNIKRGVKIIYDEVFSSEEKKLFIETIRDIHKIAKNTMNDEQVEAYYFDTCRYIGVSNKSVRNFLMIDKDVKVDVAKCIAQDHLLEYFTRTVARIKGLEPEEILEEGLYYGFSDDSLENVLSMTNHFIEKKRFNYFNYKFSTFKTGNEKDIKTIIDYADNYTSPRGDIRLETHELITELYAPGSKIIQTKVIGSIPNRHGIL